MISMIFKIKLAAKAFSQRLYGQNFIFAKMVGKNSEIKKKSGFTFFARISYVNFCHFRIVEWYSPCYAHKYFARYNFLNIVTIWTLMSFEHTVCYNSYCLSALANTIKTLCCKPFYKKILPYNLRIKLYFKSTTHR